MPDGAPRGQRPDLVEELGVRRGGHQGDDGRPAGDELHRLVGVERGRRHEVVVVALQALHDPVDERAVGLGDPVERLADPLRGAAGVGRRALDEQHVHEGPRAASLRGRGVHGGGHLVRGVAGPGRGAQHLRHQAVEHARRAPDGRPRRDPRAGPLAAHDVAGLGQAPVDRPDRVRVDAQDGAQLADGRQAGAGVEPPGVDLVGQLPVELGRDRDVRIAGDVEAAGRGRATRRRGGRGALGRRQLRRGRPGPQVRSPRCPRRTPALRPVDRRDFPPIDIVR